MPPGDEIYVSTDIETDGPNFGDYSLLSLGACDAFDPARRFYVELRPISDKFIPEALAVSGLDRERLKAEGEPPVQAMRRFVEWTRSLGGRPVFCSFSTWDAGWVWQYLNHYLGPDSSPFSHSALDMKSLALGCYGGGWRDTSKGPLRRRHPEIFIGAGAHTHNALDDALEQAMLLRGLLAAARRGR